MEFNSKVGLNNFAYLSWNFCNGISLVIKILYIKKNGLVFQSQVAYLIPIFGVILGFLFLDEAITSKIIISMIAVIIGIYIVKKGSKIKID